MRTLWFVLLAQMLLSAATPTPISFFARRDTPVGSGNFFGPGAETPSNLTIADFNGDGLPDVAVLSSPTNSLIVFMNLGNGAFREGKPINAGLVPAAVVAGDFNGDGHQDLAVVSLEGTGILLGNGDGTFQPLVNIRDAFGNALAVGDFNGDGKLDLVVGYTQSNTLDLLLGNGDGTFTSDGGVNLDTGDYFASGVNIADFNGDGKLDVAVGDPIYLLLGNGDGTFKAPWDLLTDTINHRRLCGEGEFDVRGFVRQPVDDVALDTLATMVYRALFDDSRWGQVHTDRTIDVRTPNP